MEGWESIQDPTRWVEVTDLSLRCSHHSSLLFCPTCSLLVSMMGLLCFSTFTPTMAASKMRPPRPPFLKNIISSVQRPQLTNAEEGERGWLGLSPLSTAGPISSGRGRSHGPIRSGPWEWTSKRVGCVSKKWA